MFCLPRQWIARIQIGPSSLKDFWMGIKVQWPRTWPRNPPRNGLLKSKKYSNVWKQFDSAVENDRWLDKDFLVLCHVSWKRNKKNFFFLLVISFLFCVFSHKLGFFGVACRAFHRPNRPLWNCLIIVLVLWCYRMSLIELGEEIGLIPRSHSRVAINSNKGFEAKLTHLIRNKQLPERGLGDAEVK